MIPTTLSRTGMTAALALLALAAGLPTAGAEFDPNLVPLPRQPGIEVQTRGPVHEAFAQPAAQVPEPGPEAPRQPPDPIPEQPPPEQPEGRNVQWIPGYWAWDADQNQFLWVSGTYRDAPPGQQYVQGYWTQDGDAWRWVPGFWSSAQQPELSYTPPPPQSLETGPSGPAPGDDSVYEPGNWLYQNGSWQWNQGFWMAARPGLVWVPPCYAWTPRGYVFVRGYWDYPLQDRGLLFAPVAFDQPYWQTPGWSYQPSYVLNPLGLLNALFVGPGNSSYYFGNYYGQGYAGRGYRPWYAYGQRYHDPLYGYYRWQNRGNPGWAGDLRQLYLDRSAGRAPVPPATLRQQNAFYRQNPYRGAHGGATIASRNPVPLAGSLAHGAGHVRVTPLSSAQLQAQHAALQHRQAQVTARRQGERAVRPAGPGGPVRLPANVGPQTAPGHLPQQNHIQAYRPAVTAPSHQPQTAHVQPHRAVVTAPHAAPVHHQQAVHVQRSAAPAFHAAPAVHHAPAVAHVQAAHPVQHAAVHHAPPAQHAAPVHHAPPAQHGGGGHAHAGGGGGGHHGGGHHGR